MYYTNNLNFLFTKLLYKFKQQIQEVLKFQSYSSRSIKTYISCIKIFIKYINNDISKISKKTIYEFIFNLQSQNKAPKTINLYTQSIKYFIKIDLQAVKEVSNIIK